MPTFSTVDLARLDDCDLRLQLISNRVVKYVPHRILTGHRGQAEQHEAFVTGHSKLDWPMGKHNRFPSIALDFAPVYFDVGAKINFNDIPAFARLAGHYERAAFDLGIEVRLGLDWDGDWRTSGYDPDSSFLDAGHIELIV